MRVAVDTKVQHSTVHGPLHDEVSSWTIKIKRELRFGEKGIYERAFRENMGYSPDSTKQLYTMTWTGCVTIGKVVYPRLQHTSVRGT